MRRGPIEPGQHAGERPGEIGHAVGDHRKAKFCEPAGIAIGIEHERRDLWAQPLDHPLEQRNST